MAGSADLISEVVGVRERTLAAGNARIQLVSELLLESPRREPSAFGRLVARTAKAAGAMLMRTPLRRLNFRRRVGEGVIDMVGRRYMLDYGHFAVLYTEGKLWGGRSGRAIATLEPWDEERPREPLWLLDLLAGLTEATEIDTEVVRGTPCRHLRVAVDVSRASKATPGGVAVPARSSFNELLALPMEVWSDDPTCGGCTSAWNATGPRPWNCGTWA